MTYDPVAPSPFPTPRADATRFLPLPGGTRPGPVLALLDALRARLDADVKTAPSGTAGSPPADRRNDASHAVLVPHAAGDDGAAVVGVLRSRLRRAVPANTAVVLQTSGSTTGTGHLVALAGESLVASARATEQRLAGPGQWLLAVPAHHVAGLQVLVRSVVAGTTPVVLDTTHGFDPRELASAVASMRPDVPGYLSLVPTQLVRVLEGGDDVVAPLRRLAAILVGGAATAPRALEEARAAGLRVVTTYGMTETGGGCVYDGLPLPGVRLRVARDDGRVEIAGPVLAAGYLDDPAADADAFHVADGVRWLRTSDRGVLVPRPDGAATEPGHGAATAPGHVTATEPRPAAATAAGGLLNPTELLDDVAGPLRLRVLGRVDDLINTGGIKVSPGSVERVLTEHPEVAEVAVVAVPDPEWGELVTAVVVPAPGRDAPRLPELRALVTSRLGGAHAPRALVVLTSLPLRGPGKVDRRGAALRAAEELGVPAPAGGAVQPGRSVGASIGVVRTERHDRTAPIS